jgi:hypothetical protein
MSNQRPSSTITGTQLIGKCNTLVLRLTEPSASTRGNEVRRVVGDTQKRVLQRFNQLLREYISEEREAIRSDLLQSLEEAADKEKFLEAFVLKLYHKANKMEEEIATGHLNDDERERLNRQIGDNRRPGNQNPHNRDPANYNQHNPYPANHNSHNPYPGFH